MAFARHSRPFEILSVLFILSLCHKPSTFFILQKKKCVAQKQNSFMSEWLALLAQNITTQT